jgi:myo-inositol catabolism protein IolS
MKRKFGKLDWQVFPIGFGAASISGEGGGYGFGEISEEDALSLVSRSVELGFNLFDTAPIYGFGMSEQRLGKALKLKRKSVYIVSKCGVTWDINKRVDMNNDPKIALEMLEQSLKDLQTDYIDLYMVHWPDKRVDIRKTIEVLVRQKDKGKIRQIGLCNTFMEDLKKAEEITPIAALQDSWNLFSYEDTQKRTEDALKTENYAFMGYGTFDKGILTQRVTVDRKFDKADARSWAPWWKNQDRSRKYKAVEALRKILQPYGFSLSEFCLGFSLQYKTYTTTALVGMRNDQQLLDVLASSQNLPSTKILEEILEKLKEQGFDYVS